MVTPIFVFTGSVISYKELYAQDNTSYLSKWGSLFSEFKNNKGFLSTQFYLLYFIRRFAFIISQVYINSNLLVQGGLNIGFSLMQFGFLIFYRPYKETHVLISAFTAEGCIFITNILVFIMIFDIRENKQVLMKLEATVTFIVYAIIGINTLISLFQIIKRLINILRKRLSYEKGDAKQTSDISNAKSFNINSCKIIPFNKTIESTQEIQDNI